MYPLLPAVPPHYCMNKLLLQYNNMLHIISTIHTKHILYKCWCEQSKSYSTSKFFKVLKVPKCEILDRSDFHDFYTIKPFWVGDIKYKRVTLTYGRARII
jgi:hypothetical protein